MNDGYNHSYTVHSSNRDAEIVHAGRYCTVLVLFHVYVKQKKTIVNIFVSFKNETFPHQRDLRPVSQLTALIAIKSASS